MNPKLAKNNYLPFILYPFSASYNPFIRTIEPSSTPGGRSKSRKVVPQINALGSKTKAPVGAAVPQVKQKMLDRQGVKTAQEKGLVEAIAKKEEKAKKKKTGKQFSPKQRKAGPKRKSVPSFSKKPRVKKA
jgi:hypothetical protein